MIFQFVIFTLYALHSNALPTPSSEEIDCQVGLRMRPCPIVQPKMNFTPYILEEFLEMEEVESTEITILDAWMDRQLSMIQHRMLDTEGIELHGLETMTKKNCSFNEKHDLYACRVESDHITVTNPEGQEESIELKIRIVVTTSLERWWLEIVKFERPAWMAEDDSTRADMFVLFKN